MRNLTLALVVVIAVLGGFYSGWKYSQSKLGSAASPAANISFGSPAPAASAATGGNGGFTGGFGGRGTVGQITAVNGSVVTIHNPNTGQDTKVQLSGETAISKTVAGTAADLQPGVNVAVGGQPGADGTVSATSVSIVAALPGGGRGRPSTSPSP